MEKVIGCVQCTYQISTEFVKIWGIKITACNDKPILLNIITFAALRIHVSPVTCEILEKFGTFDLELRGPVEMKVQFSYIVLFDFTLQYTSCFDY